jgi:tetratricopeptide (TPR) repeat protein
MYISCVHKALKLLIESGRLNEAEELCAKALRIDPFDEKILEFRLRSLIALGKNAEAYDEYRSMETMFYEIMGVRFSEDLRKLHNQIIRPAVDEELSLEEILDEWLKGVDYPGAFYCDLSVFKTVYQIEARNAYRSGKSSFIVRIDTKQELGDKRLGVMKQLGMVIPGNLRRGDLFTRTSPNQYMLMLHNLTYENCKMLVDRILRSLDAKRLARISDTSIKPLIPIG